MDGIPLFVFYNYVFLCYLHRITVERVSAVFGSMYLMEGLFIDAGITPFVIALYISTSPAYDTPFISTICPPPRSGECFVSTPCQLQACFEILLLLHPIRVGIGWALYLLRMV